MLVLLNCWLTNRGLCYRIPHLNIIPCKVSNSTYFVVVWWNPLFRVKFLKSLLNWFNKTHDILLYSKTYVFHFIWKYVFLFSFRELQQARDATEQDTLKPMSKVNSRLIGKKINRSMSLTIYWSNLSFCKHFM